MNPSSGGFSGGILGKYLDEPLKEFPKKSFFGEILRGTFEKLVGAIAGGVKGKELKAFILGKILIRIPEGILGEISKSDPRKLLKIFQRNLYKNFYKKLSEE